MYALPIRSFTGEAPQSETAENGPGEESWWGNREVGSGLRSSTRRHPRASAGAKPTVPVSMSAQSDPEMKAHIGAAELLLRTDRFVQTCGAGMAKCGGARCISASSSVTGKKATLRRILSAGLYPARGCQQLSILLPSTQSDPSEKIDGREGRCGRKSAHNP